MFLGVLRLIFGVGLLGFGGLVVRRRMDRSRGEMVNDLGYMKVGCFRVFFGAGLLVG